MYDLSQRRVTIMSKVTKITKVLGVIYGITLGTPDFRHLRR
jgi:hypothetical protein